MRLVVVSELPRHRTTLALRLLGAGRVLRDAIGELLALPADSPLRRDVLPVVLRLRFEVPEQPDQRTPEDKDFLMDTQELIDAWERETFEKGIEEGIEKGIEKGIGESLLDLYAARFGPVPGSIRARIESTHDTQTLRSWLKLVALGSAEEVEAALDV